MQRRWRSVARHAAALLTMAATLIAPEPLWSATAAASAGDSASQAGDNPRLPFEVVERFAKEVEQDLAAKGARLAIVFRSGETRDKLPRGVTYTHGAFWVHTPIQTVDGRLLQGYAVFNLFHGNGRSLAMNRSYLHQDFPVDFVAGTALDELGVIIPSPEMQRRILAIMDSPAYAALHVPRYSLVSHPHDARYQNCNEFMLDVIAAALWDTTDYRQIKANLAAHFKPTRIEVGLLQRMFAPMVETRISTDDQRGDIETVTFESMATFLRDNGLLQDAYSFRHAPAAHALSAPPRS